MHYGNKSEKPARGPRGNTLSGDSLNWNVKGGGSNLSGGSLNQKGAGGGKHGYYPHGFDSKPIPTNEQ